MQNIGTRHKELKNQQNDAPDYDRIFQGTLMNSHLNLMSNTQTGLKKQDDKLTTYTNMENL